MCSNLARKRNVVQTHGTIAGSYGVVVEDGDKWIVKLAPIGIPFWNSKWGNHQLERRMLNAALEESVVLGDAGRRRWS
jgi:hypothetical protein